jgi:hypothetical protein
MNCLVRYPFILQLSFLRIRVGDLVAFKNKDDHAPPKVLGESKRRSAGVRDGLFIPC